MILPGMLVTKRGIFLVSFLGCWKAGKKVDSSPKFQVSYDLDFKSAVQYMKHFICHLISKVSRPQRKYVNVDSVEITLASQVLS